MVGRRRMTVIVRAKEANGYVERATEIRGSLNVTLGIKRKYSGMVFSPSLSFFTSS